MACSSICSWLYPSLWSFFSHHKCHASFGLSFLIISAMHPVVFWHYINPSIFIIIISCNFKVLVNSSIVLFLGGFCTKDLLLLLLLRHF